MGEDWPEFYTEHESPAIPCLCSCRTGLDCTVACLNPTEMSCRSRSSCSRGPLPSVQGPDRFIRDSSGGPPRVCFGQSDDRWNVWPGV